ncbi:MAG TPA: aminopeptidase, partial [Firmicutes bacterium]|nr:aminopeptidase [Bacillota bacterium]
MNELIKKLCESFGPAGREDKVRSLIIGELEKLNAEYFIDILGNLIVARRNQGAKKILVAAHMDEIGLMITFIDDRGFLRFIGIGGVLKNILPGMKVLFENGTTGVIGQEKIKEPKEFDLDRLFIDIGAENREEALKKVNIGDTAVLLSPFS